MGKYLRFLKLKRKLWDNYISMEIVVENEVIKFFVWVPEDHLLTMQKMIASFYPWALVEIVTQPKLLEAWKFMAGGEFTLTKEWPKYKDSDRGPDFYHY